MAILSRETGKIYFFDSRVTVSQMESFLADINPVSLSDSGLAVYDRLAAYLKSESWLSFSSDAISGGMDLIIQPELYYKTNENVPWIYDRYSRNPVVLIPLGFSLGAWLSAEMELNVGENEYAATLHDNYGNIPLDPVKQFDIHFPKRAYMNGGFTMGEASGFNFAMGVGDNFFGQTRTGSIVVSEYLERTVFARATIYSPAFKYSTEVLQYEVNKYHYMHYLQVRPHQKFSISLAEGVMVNAPLELRFLNPLTIFHSYESYKTYSNYNNDVGNNNVNDNNGDSRIGSYFGVKLEYLPVQNLRLYGLFVMDVYNLPMKKEHWLDGLYPDAVGFQAGADMSIPVKGGHWEFGIEGVYTFPYLYIMWDKNWSFFKEVPELDVMTPRLRYWTGTPFGPDTIAATLWAGFRSLDGWYAGFSFTFSAQGERSDTTIFDWVDENNDPAYRPTHDYYDVTVPPSGIPIFTYTVTLRGEYDFKEYLSFILQPGYRVTVNAGEGSDTTTNAKRDKGRVEYSFELAVSVRLKLPVK